MAPHAPAEENKRVSKVKVGIVQQACSPDREANIAKLEKGIREAARRGAKLVVLQELHNGPYFCQTAEDRFFDWAETIPGPSTERFGRLAKELGIVLVTSLFEKRGAGLYHNTAVVMEKDGTIAGFYRKSHIPDDPGYYEKFYFTPGDLGFKSHQTSAGKLGVCVCWDQWFPEAARLTAMTGAQILFYPTAIGWHPAEKAELGQGQHDAWETMMRSHAIANGVFVVAPNRTGMEGNLEFWGQSFVCDPRGQILARAAADAEETLIVECNLHEIDDVRTHWPFLRDRRIDAYGDLMKRYLD